VDSPPLGREVDLYMTFMVGSMAIAAKRTAVAEAGSVPLQRVDHDREARIDGTRSVTCLAGDGNLRAHDGIIRIEQRGVTTLAVRLEHLILPQFGARRGVRATSPRDVYGAVTGTTRPATHRVERLPP
jgi:hypothetical protein